jgi:hypothetical protein
VRRDGPSPTPSAWPSTQTSIRNSFSWSGPLASTIRYSGRAPVRRWVYSWSRLLGLFRRRLGESFASSGSASVESQDLVVSQPRSS